MELLKYIPIWFSRSCCVLEAPEGNKWMCDECVMHKDCIWLNLTIFILLYQDLFFLEYFFAKIMHSSGRLGDVVPLGLQTL